MGEKADRSLAADSSEAEATPQVADSSGVVAAGRGDRERLRAGEITKDEYLDRSVERATAHLEGRLEAGKLEAMRQLLRAELESDPFLAALTSQATDA